MITTIIIEGITISIGAEIVRVTFHPAHKSKKEGAIKRAIREFWRNNYFRRHTKTYLSVKAAEIVSRCIGIHSAYLIAREYVWPHIPTVVAFVRSIDWPSFLFHVDVGFILGVIASAVIYYGKQAICEMMRGERRNEA